MQRLARDKIRRILEEQERMNYELEKKRRKIESWNKELNKREAVTERERMKLDEDKKKVILLQQKAVLLAFLFFTSRN